jgi:D-serine deaminase-like pyridoxal phosphate-dependent protein
VRTVHDLATPAVVVDVRRLQANVEAMARRAAASGVELWPHAKTHKSRQVAELQRDHGAAGLTVATVAEAEYFVAQGFRDVLLAFPPVDEWRRARLTALAAEARIRVSLDDPELALVLDRECARRGVRIGYLWEVDCGTGRCGTAPGDATASVIARLVAQTSHATFAGLLAFAGHCYQAESTQELDSVALGERAAVALTAEALAAHGIETPAISIGSTPTCHRLNGQAAPVTEIRPGNYVFHDATQILLGVARPEDCALSVVCTVISRVAGDRVVLDGGSKAIAAERMNPRSVDFGLVEGHPELAVSRLYEEHGIVTGEGASALHVGDRVRVIPNHACTAANLHERLYVVDGEEVVDTWEVGPRHWATA